jgi:hypothetical protein
VSFGLIQASRNVSLSDDAYNHMVMIHYRHPPQLVICHGIHCLLDIIIHIAGNDV